MVLNFSPVTADMKSAYIQSSPTQRMVNGHPPKDLDARQSTIWKLLPLPHGAVEAKRLSSFATTQAKDHLLTQKNDRFELGQVG